MLVPDSFIQSQIVHDWLRWQTDLGEFAWHKIEEHGYIWMFIFLFSSGIGLPLPEDVPLLAAGYCIARQSMTWAIAGPVAWLAMMCGDSALYVLGYLLGWRVVHLPLLGRHVSTKRLQRCEWFDRWGIWAVGIGRMFAGIRTAIVVTAGTMRFNYGKLLLADGVAAIVSGGAFIVLGYWAGLHAGQVRPIVEHYRRLFSVIALAAAWVLVAVLWWRARQKAAAATAARKEAAGEEVAHPVKPM